MILQHWKEFQAIMDPMTSTKIAQLTLHHAKVATAVIARAVFKDNILIGFLLRKINSLHHSERKFKVYVSLSVPDWRPRGCRSLTGRREENSRGSRGIDILPKRRRPDPTEISR